MSVLFDPEFWSGHFAGAMHNWPVVIPLLLLAAFIGWWWRGSNDEGEVRGVRAKNEALEAHLSLAKDQNVSGMKAMHEFRSELAVLRKRMDEKDPALTPLVITAERSAGLVEASTTAVGHTLTTAALLAADREEVEKILQQDTDAIADSLGAIWEILERFDPKSDPAKMKGVVWGLEVIAHISSRSRKMVDVLGWKRRRSAEQLFDGLDRLARFRNPDTFDRNEALAAISSVSVDVENVRPDTTKYFEGRYGRPVKAGSMKLGDTIEVLAGVANQPKSKSPPENMA
jgi:hypothetical protein